MLPPASQLFGEVQCGRTTLNSVEPTLSARFPLHHSGLGRFGVVEPPRTQSNLPCRPASPFITVVRGSSYIERKELEEVDVFAAVPDTGV